MSRVVQLALGVAGAACGTNGGGGYGVPPQGSADAATAGQDGSIAAIDGAIDGASDGANGAADAASDAASDGSAAGADLSIAIGDAPDPVAASSTLIYTIDVTNHGGRDATGIKVTQRLPSGNVAFQSAIGIGWTCTAAGQLVTCARDTLLTGTAPSIAVTVTTPPLGGTLSTTATVEAQTFDPDLENNDAAAATLVLTPADLAIAIADGPDPIAAGGTLSYTITVTDLGPRDATDLVVTNRLPDGNVQFVSALGIGWACALAGQIVTCTRPLLIVGAAPSIAIQIITPASNGALIDQASVTGSTADLDLDNNTATNTTTVFDSAGLSITASESPGPVRIGTNLTYTLSVGNAGPTSATAVTVVDTLPAGTTFVSAIGAGWSCSEGTGVVTCTMASLGASSSAPAISIVATAPNTERNITNTATVSSSTSDPDGADNTASTVTLANALADLQLTLTDSPDPVQGTANAGCTANDCVTYAIDVTNLGPDTATQLTVVTALPPNGSFFDAEGTGWICPAPTATTLTCTRTSLAVGAAPTINLVWKAPNPGGFSIVASSTVSGSIDPDVTNNTATQDTTVKP